MKHLRAVAILTGLAAYAVAFYMTPLPSLQNDAGRPPWRIETLVLLLLRPDEWLFSHWFGLPPQFAFADRLPVLLVAGMILAWAAAVGWLLMTPFRIRLTRLETAVFAMAVGLNALSTWVLLLGLCGLLDRTWTFVVPAILTFLAVVCVWYWRKKGVFSDVIGSWFPRSAWEPAFSDAPRQSGRHRASLTVRPHAERGNESIAGTAVDADLRWPLAAGYSHDAFGLRWLWLALPFVLAILLAAMLPPLDFDVCEYHLQAPKEFFQQGRITFLPHNVYANMAMGAEMLSLLAMVIAGDWWWGALAGKTVIAAFTPLCALALLAAGRRFFSTGAGVVAALVYVSIPWVVSISSAGLVEGASACYLFLAVYALLLSGLSRSRSAAVPAASGGQDARAPAYLVLAGYLGGGAVATKYPAVLFVLLPLAVWVLVRGFGTRGSGGGGRGRVLTPVPSPQSRVPSPESPIPSPESRVPSPIFSHLIALTVFLLAATAGCGLWFGKNWVLTGNPTYPLLYEAFDGKTWNVDKQRQWNHVHRPQDFSAKTFGKDLGRVVLTSEWLSPLVVPLAVLAFVGGPRTMGRSRLVWGLLAYASFVIAVWWLFTHRIDRFWIPVLPVLALLAGAGAYWSSEQWWQRLLKGLLLAGLGANFLVASAGQGNAWFVPLEQLRNDPRWINPWHWYFNLDPIKGGVLAVGDAAVFDLKPPVLYNTCFDDCIFEQLAKGKTAAEIRAELTSRHIAYVFVNWGEIARYRRTYGYTDFVQPEVFDRLVEQGVLEPLPPLPGQPQQAYRVK